MNRTNLCDISRPGDALWFQNLQLLGFAHHNPSFPFHQSMYDHSNPVAFQHVFYYMFSLLSVEKTKTEFRDCWPILDRKQEAEFRRKVITILKEYQKDFPTDLPYCNPSLFQSPGGRKFVSFLLVFSNFVLKMLLDSEHVLAKPVVKNNPKLKKVSHKLLVKSTKRALDKSVKLQAEQEEIVVGAEVAINELSRKYFKIKEYIENAQNIDENEDKLEHVKIFNNNKIDTTDVLRYYDEKCTKMKSLKLNFETFFCQHKSIWETIAEVVENYALKSKLNFDLLPANLIAVEDLKMTYQNMIAQVLSIMDKVLQIETRHRCPHANELSERTSALSIKMELFNEVRADLGILVSKMKESVKFMLDISSRIDWSNCELALSMPSRNREASSEVLLPPTPSLMENIKSDQSNPKIPGSLQLLSPTPCKSGTITDPIATVTPISTGQVMRRFPRHITTDQSPLLRQSLLQSTRLRVEDDQRHSMNTDSRSSVDVFSPVLSSTIHQSLPLHSIESTPSLDFEVQTQPNKILTQNENPGSFTTTATCPTFGSLRAASDDNVDETQTKIDEYKQILLSAKSKELPDRDNRSSLLNAWNYHRKSLSPQTPRINLSICSMDNDDGTPPTLQNTPLFGDMTTVPDMSNTPDMTRRLDQLMSSLTFSDTSLDLSLGKMSLGGEELLSPHCP